MYTIADLADVNYTCNNRRAGCKLAKEKKQKRVDCPTDASLSFVLLHTAQKIQLSFNGIFENAAAAVK
jgi:hypothetical protein